MALSVHEGRKKRKKEKRGSTVNYGTANLRRRKKIERRESV